MGFLSKFFGGGEKKSQPAVKNEPLEEGKGVAAKGNIEVKTGRLGRTKVIEASLGPDGKPIYTGQQLNSAVNKYKQRKTARAQAKAEENAYVEFRKAEILKQFQPKVGTLRLGDEAFPKRRRVAMGFGERKAHFLAIRPKPKYASWFGRKRGAIEAKAQAAPVQPSAAVVTDHSMLPEAKSVRHHKEDDNNNNNNNHEEHSAPVVEKKTDDEKGTDDKDDDETEQKKEPPGPPPVKIGEFALTPERKTAPMKIRPHKDPTKRVTNTNPKAEPFWINANGQQEEEATDDDLPVDMEVLEKVCAGEKILAQKPYNKIEFHPFGSIAKMKEDDCLFGRETHLFANTVESVISLQPDDQNKGKKKAPPKHVIKIQWQPKVRVVPFHPATRVTHVPDKPFEEDLRNIVRDAESAKNAPPK